MPNRLKLTFLLILVLTLGLVLTFTDLASWLSLESWNQQREHLRQRAQESSVFPLFFFLSYVVVTAFSLPGALVMTLAAGHLFGVLKGLVLVSFASTLGATCAFLLSRWLLRSWVESWGGEKIRLIQDQFRQHGAFSLFSLRLVPIFPFFAVNLLMGLTPLRWTRFFWVSQLGMLPGTWVYVNAGHEFGEIRSLQDLLSPPVWIAFLALAALPWLAQGFVSRLRRARQFKAFTRPTHFDYNLIVVGGGAAGLVASAVAAALKAKVALIEKNKMGGDCLHTGCIPSKSLLKSAHAAHEARQAHQWGLSIPQIEVRFSAVMERVKNIIQKIEPHDSAERFESLGVDCFHGEAQFQSPWEIQVGDRRLTAKKFILATGARARKAHWPGLESLPTYTAENIWTLTDRPSHLLVIGGGAIGCELAQAFARLGSSVSLIERGPRLLSKEEPEASELLLKSLRQDGVKVELETEVENFDSNENGRQEVRLRSKQGPFAHPVSHVLLALGREPRLHGFGLERLGLLNQDTRILNTTPQLQTDFDHIWACGDLTSPEQFTHVAGHQGALAALNALFSPWLRLNAKKDLIPRVTYTEPEVAHLGPTRHELEQAAIPFEITRFEMSSLDRALTEGKPEGFVQVLTPPGRDRLLAVTVCGARAGEILQSFHLGMKAGWGLRKMQSVIHPYPSFTEAGKLIAGRWRQKNSSKKIIAWLALYHQWRRS